MQLNKLKSGIKYDTQVTSNYSSDAVDVSNDTTNFPYKLLIFNTHVLKIRKTFANCSSANIKYSKTQLSKIIQLGRILGPPELYNVTSLPIRFVD